MYDKVWDALHVSELQFLQKLSQQFFLHDLSKLMIDLFQHQDIYNPAMD